MERIWLKSYPEGVPVDIDLAGGVPELIVRRAGQDCRTRR